jgi:PAS domain S-box-containing protein
LNREANDSDFLALGGWHPMSKLKRGDRVLTWVLPLLPAVVALLLLGSVLILAERKVGSELERRASQRVEHSVSDLSIEVSRMLARRVIEIDLLGVLARTDIDADAWRAQMQRLKGTSSSYVWIGATDERGVVQVATDGLLEGMSIATHPVFINGRQGAWFGSLHPPVALREPLRVHGLPVPTDLADIALPIFDSDGRARGVIAAHLDARYFDGLLQEMLGPVEGRRFLKFAIIDGNGSVMLGERPEMPESAWTDLLLGPPTEARFFRDVKGEAVLLARAPVAPEDSPLRPPWQVVAAQPLSAALAPMKQFERSLLAWGGFATLLIGLTGFVLSRRLVRPYSESEKRLREQGEVLTAVVNSASDAIINVDEDGRITLFNPAAARIFGHAPEHMVGQPLDVLLPPNQRGIHLARLQRFSDSPSTTRPVGRVKGVRADGQVLELEASISQITVRGRRLLNAILRDVTERMRDDRALKRYQSKLSELTRRLLSQEKQTARKLAQILHDQLGQTLGAISLSFDALSSLATADLSPEARERERKLGVLIEQAVLEVRQALVAMRPPLLEEAGLPAALHNEVRARAAEAEPLVLRLEVAPAAVALRWPGDVEYAAYMIAREALANALLHARATEVVVTVDGAPGWLHLQVTDDGVGLSPDLTGGRPGHLGIVGMRERALAIGAHLETHNSSSGGAVVSLKWGDEQQVGSGSARGPLNDGWH